MVNDNWSYEDEWFEETNVLNVVKNYLENKGWNIVKFSEMKTDKGHDLEAKNGKDTLVLECKGFPSEYYVKGARKGERSRTNPKLQAHHWLTDVLYTVLKAKSKDPNVKVAIALPSIDGFYEKLIGEVSIVNEKFNISYYFVRRDGTVSEIVP